MRVLYASHTGRLGGGEHSLLGMLAALGDQVEPVVAAPEGPLAVAVRTAGIGFVPIPGISGSFAFHPIRTIRALADVLAEALALRREARRGNVELVHANSVRAGLAAVLAARIGGRPAIVHVRDCLPPGLGSLLVRRTISVGARVVLANAVYTAERFRTGSPIEVVYPSIEVARFDPNFADRRALRAGFGISSDAFVLGVVAQLTPWKGQDLAIRVLARIRSALPTAQLVLVGEAKFAGPAVRYDNAAYERTLRAAVSASGLEGMVRFLGEQEDVASILGTFDVLLAPSWEEPFGRAILEGMAMELPVLATNVGGPSEFVEHGRSGFLLDPHDEEAWARRVLELASDVELRARLGAQARLRALEFSRAREADCLLIAYRRALCRETATIDASVELSGSR